VIEYREEWKQRRTQIDWVFDSATMQSREKRMSHYILRIGTRMELSRGGPMAFFLYFAFLCSHGFSVEFALVSQ